MEFDAAWAAITDQPPIAHQLKASLNHRWVRFYSLPDGKRYADTDAERRIIQDRTDAVAQHVLGTGTTVLLVTGQAAPSTVVPAITASQSSVHSDPTSWAMHTYDPSDEDDVSLHLVASWEQYHQQSLELLISMTAESELMEVLVVEPEAGVAIHPYDGGLDVIAANPGDRDALRSAFAEWASPLASGL